MSDKIMHPVQIHSVGRDRGKSAMVDSAITLRAYEVYCHVYSEQKALITGGCRGGFGIGELIAFLYARSFPKAEWKDRVDECFRGGMVNL